MRLEKLRVKGLGPFRDTTLDLASIPHQILAVCGENGAGKTTLVELFAGAVYRDCPTHGSLSGLATERDSWVEATVVTDQRFTVRQLVDKVSGKGETSIVDESGTALIASAKLTEGDAWLEKHTPPSEVFFASAFLAQKGEGFLAQKAGERKAALLRVLGLERYEAMAELARKRAATLRDDLRVLRARLDDEAGRAKVEEAELRYAARSVERAEAEVQAARSALDAALAEEAQWTERRAAQRAALARLDDLTRKIAEGTRRIGDLGERLGNNRAVLARRAEIERAVSEAAELDLAIRERDQIQAAHRKALDDAQRALDSARARLSRAKTAASQAVGFHRSAVQREEGERREIEAARLALPAAEVEHAEAVARSRRAAAELEQLQSRTIAGAGQRISALREGLEDIEMAAEDIEQARDIAHAALARDWATVEDAESRPGLIAAARRETEEAARQETTARMHLSILRNALAREPELARCAAERESARVRVEAAEKEVVEALAEVEMRIEEGAAIEGQTITTAAELRERREMLAPLLRLAPGLAQAEARIAEIQPQILTLTAEVETAKRERLAVEVEDIPHPRRPMGELESAVEIATAARSTAISRHAVAARDAEAAREARAKADAMMIDITAAEQRLADWTRLAADLGRDGLQALEIDAALPELTERANDLLHSCHGSRWTVRIESTRASADGKKQIEGLAVWVLDTQAGREGPGETYSGGERVILAEAVALPLVALWCERQGVERPTLVRDESGAALREDNAVAYVAMLRRAASWIGADKVLVVTHSDEIRRLSDATVVVADGAATVVADAGALAA